MRLRFATPSSRTPHDQRNSRKASQKVMTAQRYGKILNLSMTSPFGHAQFEASAAAIETFLARTYELVPAGQESAFLNLDAELAELLSQA